MIITSKVPGYVGLCKPTWINRNQICHRIDGGITGFFKLVRKKWGIYWRTGKEFHGIIEDGVVKTTEGRYR